MGIIDIAKAIFGKGKRTAAAIDAKLKQINESAGRIASVAGVLKRKCTLAGQKGIISGTKEICTEYDEMIVFLQELRREMQESSEELEESALDIPTGSLRDKARDLSRQISVLQDAVEKFSMFNSELYATTSDKEVKDCADILSAESKNIIGLLQDLVNLMKEW